MLHIVKSLDKLTLVLDLLIDGDELILTENSVYAALPNHDYFSRMQSINSVSVLEADVQSRGLQNLVANSITQVDFETFVDLTIYNVKSITW
ncbi:sulfurtransferase complex subunit TusB [Vibrio makurazakiensis]|uniref:sulfurtransferase complex subunit TusB n=1 Tax=Vibrio makurazakiensis TaxID=2910250 RepID=UPI003D13406C